MSLFGWAAFILSQVLEHIVEVKSEVQNDSTCSSFFRPGRGYATERIGHITSDSFSSQAVAGYVPTAI